MLASVSTNVKVFIEVFKTLLFPSLITDLFHLWYDETYGSKILRSTIPTLLGHVKVKVTDLEFSCDSILDHILSTVKEKVYPIPKKKKRKKNDLPTSLPTHSEIDG